MSDGRGIAPLLAVRGSIGPGNTERRSEALANIRGIVVVSGNFAQRVKHRTVFDLAALRGIVNAALGTNFPIID